MTITEHQRRARHIDCTLDEYHSRPEWSNSQLSVLLASPALFHGRFITKTYPRVSTQAMDVGSAAHALLSSPADRETVLEIPADALNADGHKKGAAWKQFAAEHEGTILLKPAEFAMVQQMVSNTYDCLPAGQILRQAIHYEFTLLWKDVDSGLSLRARPDLIVGHKGRVIVPDFKTTRCLTPREFAADAAKLGYHRQAACYSDAVALFGYDVAGFVFVTVDKSPAHECRVYELPPCAIELGREENRMARRDLARRLAEDDWTDPLSREIMQVDLPKWAYTNPWRM